MSRELILVPSNELGKQILTQSILMVQDYYFLK